MNKNVLNNNAFSLLEILLASIILIISVAGIFVTSNNIRGPVISKENALAAAVFGKQVTEALYSQVSGSSTSNYATCLGDLDGLGNCKDFSLYPGPHIVPNAVVPAGSCQYPPCSVQEAGLNWPNSISTSNGSGGCGSTPCLVYTVTCANNPPDTTPALCLADSSSARIVNLSINWPSFP